MDPLAPGKRIAVVGSGAAGLSAAWYLQRRHEVTLLERTPRIGGHVHTVRVPHGPDAGTAVDMGFIVYNERNYPRFTALLDELGVASQPGDMSFGYSCERSGLQYAGTGLDGLFAQRANLVRPGHWRLLSGILRFGRLGREALVSDNGAAAGTLGEFLDRSGVDDATERHFVLPMGAAIWSGSRDDIRSFPAGHFLRFFDNHGLLGLGDRPAWRTITGGSDRWTGRLLERFAGEVKTSCPVRSLRRGEDGVEVGVDGRPEERFDAVVVATHADQALGLLERPTRAEERLLGAWRYSHNLAWLHTDRSALPSNRRAWASWNYLRRRSAGEAAPVAVTYDMNRLQRIDARSRYLVTLNPDAAVAEKSVIEEVRFTHPICEPGSVASQAELPSLNGVDRIWYCGAHFRNGFHEDAVASGVAVAADFGVEP